MKSKRRNIRKLAVWLHQTKITCDRSESGEGHPWGGAERQAIGAEIGDHHLYSLPRIVSLPSLTLEMSGICNTLHPDKGAYPPQCLSGPTTGSKKTLKQLQGNWDVGHRKAEELELGEQTTEMYSGVGVEGRRGRAEKILIAELKGWPPRAVLSTWAK